jgi:hypothetical protein
MLDEYLVNMKIENCRENPEVTAAVFRRPPVTLRGSDFDPLPGKALSYSGTREENSFFYQSGTGMAIRVEEGHDPMEAPGWARWGIYSVELRDGEFAVYSIHRTAEGTKLNLNLTVRESGTITVAQDDKPLGGKQVNAGDEASFKLHAAAESRITVKAESGCFVLNSLSFG